MLEAAVRPLGQRPTWPHSSLPMDCLAIPHLTSPTLSFSPFPFLLGINSAPSPSLGLQHRCPCLLGERCPHNLRWGPKPSRSEAKHQRGLWGWRRGCHSLRGAGDEPDTEYPSAEPWAPGVFLPGDTGTLLHVLGTGHSTVGDGTAGGGMDMDGTARGGTAGNGTARDGMARDGTVKDGTAGGGMARDGTVGDGTARGWHSWGWHGWGWLLQGGWLVQHRVLPKHPPCKPQYSQPRASVLSLGQPHRCLWIQ